MSKAIAIQLPTDMVWVPFVGYVKSDAPDGSKTTVQSEANRSMELKRPTEVRMTVGWRDKFVTPKQMSAIKHREEIKNSLRKRGIDIEAFDTNLWNSRMFVQHGGDYYGTFPKLRKRK